MLKIEELKCNQCGHEFEEYLDIPEDSTDVPLPKCPKCESSDTRVIRGKPAAYKHSSWSQF
jgi:putative FmdB family regulatory protein